MERRKIGEFEIEITKKRIKNMYLRLHAPDARISISAPLHTSLSKIETFVFSRHSWIKKQQKTILTRTKSNPIPYKNAYPFLGEIYHLKTIEQASKKAKIELSGNEMFLFVQAGTNATKRAAIIEAWYRQEMKKRVANLLPFWEKKIGVQVNEFGIKKMKTRWGTCNISARRIWLNLDLIRKPQHCLELVMVHELVHLLERKHNRRFYDFMDKFMPNWKIYEAELKNLGLYNC